MSSKKAKTNKKIAIVTVIVLMITSVITIISLTEIHLQDGQIYTRAHNYRPLPDGGGLTCTAFTPGCGVCIGGSTGSDGIIKKNIFGKKSCYLAL